MHVTSRCLLCTDGSERSTQALAAGWALLGPDAVPVVVTVADTPDPTLLTGSGFGGPVVSPRSSTSRPSGRSPTPDRSWTATVEALGLAGAETTVLSGDPATAIGQLAEDLSARAIVVGSRGRGGLKRAVLGSVSDHLVRHAPCTVVVTGEQQERGTS